MRHRAVGSVMTGDVVAVTAPTSAPASAALMAEHGVNGLPVVDGDDRVVGMLSASDLPPREERARLTRLLRPRRSAPGAPGTTGEAMTTPAVVVHAEESIAGAARTMAGHGVERLPVVDEEDRLVGMVTRRDLLAVFHRPDDEIRREVREALAVLGDTLGLDPGAVGARVEDGVVTLKGRLRRARERTVLVRLVEHTDGVVSVRDELTWDDAAPARPVRDPVRRGPPGGAGR